MLRKELADRIREFRSQSKEFVSNLVYSKLNDEEDYTVVLENGALAILKEEPNRTSVFFAAVNVSELAQLLKKLPAGVYIETFHPERKDEAKLFLEDSGFDCYAQYVRITTTYLTSPYSVPEEGRRKILWSMYDSAMGEVPQLEDAEELYELSKEKFDETIDDVFTVEEWKEAIAKKECLVVKEGGKIVAVYKWRLEGKKLYSNIAINDGPANLLYNLERQVFEKYWNEGIRIYYAWFNITNTKAMSRGPKEKKKKMVKSKTALYNSIYVKK